MAVSSYVWAFFPNWTRTNFFKGEKRIKENDERADRILVAPRTWKPRFHLLRFVYLLIFFSESQSTWKRLWSIVFSSPEGAKVQMSKVTVCSKRGTKRGQRSNDTVVRQSSPHTFLPFYLTRAFLLDVTLFQLIKCVFKNQKY